MPTMYDFHDSTNMTLWNSEQKNGLFKKLFVFHPILMQLGETAVHMGNYNFTKFHQNQMKNKKVLLMAHFSVQNFKVSVESWKSYIVRLPQRLKPIFLKFFLHSAGLLQGRSVQKKFIKHFRKMKKLHFFPVFRALWRRTDSNNWIFPIFSSPYVGKTSWTTYPQNYKFSTSEPKGQGNKQLSQSQTKRQCQKFLYWWFLLLFLLL